MWLDSWRDGTVFILQTKKRKFRDVKQFVKSHTDFFLMCYFIYFFKSLSIYFWLSWTFSGLSLVAVSGGLLLTAAPGLLVAVAFLVAEAVL